MSERVVEAVLAGVLVMVLLGSGDVGALARQPLLPQEMQARAQPGDDADQGTIAVWLHACPAGMRPLDFAPEDCVIDADVADIQVFVVGSGENRRDLSEAVRAGDLFTWDALPFGEYVLQATGFAAGYDRFLIPDLQQGLNISPDLGYTAGPNEGYLLPLDAANPTHQLDVYVFRAFSGEGAARLDVRFWQCPPSAAAAPDMRRLGCAALDSPPGGFAIEITGAGAPVPLTLDTTTPGNDGDLGWDDVPSGEYRLASRLPEGTPGYAVRSYDPDLRVHLLADRSGYALALEPEERTSPATTTLDIYLLQ